MQVQRDTLTIVEARFKASTTSELDVDQARSTLAATEAAIPELEISLRQTINQLCILMGMPPEELRLRLGPGNIPTAPPEVVVGIPADLLRRRPDVRAAERTLARSVGVDRRRRGRVLPRTFPSSATSAGRLRLRSHLFTARLAQRQLRPVVHVEYPQLRPDSQ